MDRFVVSVRKNEKYRTADIKRDKSQSGQTEKKAKQTEPNLERTRERGDKNTHTETETERERYSGMMANSHGISTLEQWQFNNDYRKKKYKSATQKSDTHTHTGKVVGEGEC